jgi:hypothetical protein
MARLIPDFIHKDAPPGEKQIFATLRNSQRGADWVILHSLNLPRHLRQNAGEIDFLIMVPGKGILILEVKSHQRVRRDNGFWYLGDDPPSARSPFEQASAAMYSLKRDLGPALTGGVPFTYAVAFTSVRFEENAAEWEPWQVLDNRSNGDDALHDAIENTLDKNREKLLRMSMNPEQQQAVAWFRPDAGAPNIGRIREIVAHVRGDFEMYVSPNDLNCGLQAEYKRFLDEQYELLDSMSANQRTIFEGPAGTGKTLLAVEAARRAVNNGLPTLLLCFNRMLANFLMFEIRDASGFIGTIDKFVIHKTGLAVRHGDPLAYFREAAENLQKGLSVANSYGCIIIDEAQDFCSVGAVELVAEIVRQNPSAQLRLFGDFENQNIQIFEAAGRDALFAQIPDLVSAKLTRNCRNRPGVGAVVHHVTGLRDLYKGYRLPDSPDTFDLERTPYPVTTETLERVIERVYKRFVPSAVAVLSGGESIPTRAFGRFSRFLTDDINQWRPNGSLGISTTIRKFKGLDAQVVLLVNLPDDLDSALLYTGISRAIEKVYILCPRTLIDELVRRMSGMRST